MSYFRNRIHTATLLLLALSLIVFFARGARRSLTDSGDFSTVYASTRCWLAHENPYLEANVEQQYASGKGDPAHKPNADLTASVYLPSIFPLVAPVAWLDWKAAERAWLLLSLIAFSISLVCVARSELIRNLNVAVAIVSVFLLCSATHTGIAKGQPSRHGDAQVSACPLTQKRALESADDRGAAEDKLDGRGRRIGIVQDGPSERPCNIVNAHRVPGSYDLS